MRSFFLTAVALFLVVVSLPTARTSSNTSCEPVIEDVTPASVFVGETIVISGTCLSEGLAGDGVTVSLGDAPIVVTAASATEIVGQVNTPDISDIVTLKTSAGEAEAALDVKNWIEPPESVFNAGVIEVKLKAGATIEQLIAELGGHGPEFIFEGWDFPELAGWWRVQVDGDTITRVREWADHPDVEWSQPDVVIPMTFNDVPNDPCYPDPTPPSCDTFQYTSGGIIHGDNGQWGLQRIAAEGAWPIESGDASVRLAVIDSGMDIGIGEELYDEIGARVVVSRDLTDTGIVPFHSHGTRVAGVAAASTDNGLGVAGVAPEVSVVSYKVLNQYGLFVDEWYLALLFAIADGVDVVNMSFGYEGDEDGAYDMLGQVVVQAAHNNGIVLVASAGNSGDDLDAPGLFIAPAEYNHVLTVAATGDNDERGQFADPPNPVESSNYGSAVEISAPGVDIMSTNWTLQGSPPYRASSGTSFSAPMVAGVGALLASRGFYACETVETLTGLDQFGNAISADPITWQGGGVGRLNAQKALEWWGGGPIVSDTVWPDGAVIHEEGSSDRYVNNGGVMQLVTGGFDERNDQCIPPAVFNAIGDSDGDGWINGADNCPSWPNADQQLPPWTVPANDPDCDGWTSATEDFIGTNASNHCAADDTADNEPLPDAWPPDFDDNQWVNIADILKFKPVFGSPSARHDLDASGGNINIVDVQKMQPWFGKQCDP